MTILETPRLVLRRMTEEDEMNLRRTLQDEQAMYAYEGAFTDEEVRSWLRRQLQRYEEYGFGLWAVILKDTGEFIGQCGVTMQAVGDELVPEVGYLFERAHWHKGYATEAARACRDYALDTLGFDAVYSIIRDTNLASQGVAKRNGMAVCSTFTKHYRGVDMPHLVFRVERAKP